MGNTLLNNLTPVSQLAERTLANGSKLFMRYRLIIPFTELL
jgi:hypothetical protein